MLLFLSNQLMAQEEDSLTNQNGKGYQYLLPVGLIISGVAINNSSLEKKLKHSIRNKLGEDYYFGIDDYTQYAPIATLAIANLAGIEAKNHWFDQAKYLVISNVVVSAITHGLKRTINKTRPNGEAYAFPSGHTSFAFTNAMVLYKEYQLTNGVIAYSGFAFAGTTAAFRIINNKHWLSDVLAGAGIAIFVTELVYQLEPFKNFNPFLHQNTFSLLPQFGPNQQYGLSLNIKL